MAQLYEEFEKAREKWRLDRTELEAKAESLEEAASSARAKAVEYEDHMKAINNGKDLSQRLYEDSNKLFVFPGENAIIQKIADTTRTVALLKSNEAIMIRRYKAVEESEVFLRKENVKLKEERVLAENAVIEKMGILQR